MAQISTYLPLLAILRDATVFRAPLGRHLSLLRSCLDQDRIFGLSASHDLLQLLESNSFLYDPGISVLRLYVIRAARPAMLHKLSVGPGTSAELRGLVSEGLTHGYGHRGLAGLDRLAVRVKQRACALGDRAGLTGRDRGEDRVTPGYDWGRPFGFTLEL